MLDEALRHNVTKDVRRGRFQFLCTLGTGMLLSSFWFIIHVRLSQLTKTDTEVINHAGRLRYLTQSAGVKLLVAELLADTSSQQLSDPNAFFDVTAQIELICRALLGQAHKVTEAEYDLPPEAADDLVKESLQDWRASYFSPLRDDGARVILMRKQGASTEDIQAQLVNAIQRVESGTMAVDKIVDLASMEARGRAHAVLLASVARLLFGLVWATVTACAFGKVWRPYVATYNSLQEAERQYTSLLRGVFDVIVPVSMKAPYNLLGMRNELSDFVGRPLEDNSVLKCADDLDEQSKLEKLVVAANVVSHESATHDTRLRSAWWWTLLPQAPLKERPVAPMVRSTWSYGPADHPQGKLNVDVFVVSHPWGLHVGMPTWLAVRRVPNAEIEVLSADAENGHSSCDVALFAPPPVVEQPPASSSQQDLLWSISIPQADQVQYDDSLAARSVLDNRSSSADTASHIPIMAAQAGTFTPHSELDATPPPTMIGRRATIAQRDILETSMDYASVAGQLMTAVETMMTTRRSDAETATSATSATSGNRTPEMPRGAYAQQPCAGRASDGLSGVRTPVLPVGSNAYARADATSPLPATSVSSSGQQVVGCRRSSARSRSRTPDLQSGAQVDAQHALHGVGGGISSGSLTPELSWTQL